MSSTTTLSSRGGGLPFPGSCLEAVGLVGNISHAGIARSLRFMKLNFHRPIRVPELEKCSGLSHRGFAKAFQRHLGISPGQLLIQWRMALAKRLLAEQDLTLSQLAAACGFRRVNSFVVTFRRQVGLAPMQFRRQLGRTGERRAPSAHPERETLSPRRDRGPLLQRKGAARSKLQISCTPVASRMV